MSAIRILPRTLFFGCILLSCVGFATGHALAQVPCSQSDPAVCDGGCPAGEQCFPDVTGGPCRCLPTTIPCEQSPFPECGGECPSADLVCAPPPGAANCECLPAVQACEQGPFPECGGECPPDLTCVTNVALNECVCEPIFIACEQSPFPVCDGECPQNQVCEPIAGTTVCRCVPVVVPCEQGPFPECAGECPTATHCEPTGTTVNLPSPDLPPEPNPPDCDRVVSMYEGQDVHALFPNGIDFSNPIHKCFQNVVTTTQGQDEFESFNSVVEGVFDDGSGPTPIQLVGPVVVKVSGKAGQSTGSWDTEMVSMSLTGEVGGIPVEIRESPNKPSAGQTTVTDNGDGTFFVDSFFDVFTEISVDGGPFEPQVNPPGRLTLVPATPGTPDTCECVPDVVPCNQGPFPECGGECPSDQACVADDSLNKCFCALPPVDCELSDPATCDGVCPDPNDVCTPQTNPILPSPDLPPESQSPGTPDCDQVLSQYEGQDVHALFPGGIDFSNPQHKCFINVIRQDDGSGNEVETFDSTVDAQVDLGGGPVPVTVTGPVMVVTYGKTGNTTGTFATEMVSLSLTGNVAGVPVEIRESPSLASTGRTTITDLGGGQWQIDSFFDVFTELSVEGGPFQPQTNPAGRMRLVPTTPNPCECLPAACDLSDPLTCDGPCLNAGEICTADPDGGPCFCETPPAPCELSPHPECGGECPADQVCEPDASGLAECACVPIGQECSQCGAGPHFVDQCGPFPPVGTDLVANNTALVGIDVDMDCVRDLSLVLRPCPAPDQLLHVEKTLGPIDDSVNFPGTSPVDGHPTGPGLDVIDTEIVSLCLTNGAITLAAGVGGPSVLPLQPSLGAVAEDLTTPDSAMADSFFDVFFEVSGIAGGPVYNQTPLQVQSRIDCLPPAAGYRHPAGICIPLTTRGICSAGPNANAPCVSDLDCPDGACDGTLTLANLVSALHTVNVPVCDNSPFPECGGECPPDEECRPSMDGTDACRCEPIQPVACEQGPFPECGGECPPDQVCTENASLNECVCEPIVVACDQSPFPVCDGECPLDQVCEPSALAAVCNCVPIIVPCEQSPYPECGGECPTDQICEPDASGLDTCGCVPLGQECSQCGAGPHFVDQCGPFPPVGTDLVANNTALVGIDVDMDCVRDLSLVLRPCPAPDQLLHVEKTLGPIDDSVNFPGTSPVDGHPTGPGLDVIDTEIVSLCLTNGAITLAAGVGGPSVLPLQPSLGAVAEDLTTPDSAMADSFFDVFFEVSGIAGGPVYNQTPLQVQSRIDCLPPAAGYRHPAGICIPLTTRGICSAGPNANAPCVSDLDCPDGACDGTLTLANLVSALHTVNVPVCDNGPFPECGGECPPDEECRPSMDGTDACRCEPIQPVACEQGPFPECGGECPADQACTANPNLNECVCEPIVVACEQSPFPECGGECPADQACEPIAGTTVCRCVPVIVPCEQGPFPECGGECPTDQVCTEDPTGVAACVCEPIVVDCEASPYPTCDGECPPDQICLRDPDNEACVCEPLVVVCEESPFPECDGDCPPDLICDADPDGTDQCRCVPPPVPCDESSPPVCDGFCPDPQQDTCVNIPGTDVCDCRPCLVNVPGHNIDMRFVSRSRIQWIGVPCAFVYNVYRFAGQRHVDANSDGLADDYGSCLLPDLLVPSAVDTAVPPSGSLLAYLVTGESSAGEGSMGFASNLLQRPNNNPCP